MVVDVGGGTSEVAVISLGGLVVARSLRVGGYDLDDAITAHIRNEHRMAIGSQSAEAIKLAVGSAMTLSDELSTEVRGRDLTRDLMGRITFTEYFHLLLTGREPTEDERFFLDLLLVSIAEHGLMPSNVAARMTLAADPRQLQLGVRWTF